MCACVPVLGVDSAVSTAARFVICVISLVVDYCCEQLGDCGGLCVAHTVGVTGPDLLGWAV